MPIYTHCLVVCLAKSNRKSQPLFIRIPGSDENNLKQLYEEWISEHHVAKESDNTGTSSYANNVTEVIENCAAMYKQNKGQGISIYTNIEK